jgi:hypothetical protein
MIHLTGQNSERVQPVDIAAATDQILRFVIFSVGSGLLDIFTS